MTTIEEAGAASIRVVLADDHEMVRAAIRSLLEQMRGIRIVAEARDGEELVRIVGDLVPDVVVTDISMPRVDGFEAMAAIRQAHPGVRMIALSMSDTAGHVKRATACSACGYVTKDAAPADLELAIRGVMERGRHFDPRIAQLLLQPSPPAPSQLLTPRQLDILAQLALGRCSKQIGHARGLSPKTVDVHRANIMERLQLKNVASLTRYAVREGLVAA